MEQRCYYCMQVMKDGDASCAHCAKSNRETAQKQPRFALPCGKVLHGRYMIGRMLGQGGFGLTYIGFDQVLLTRVCIKEYYPSDIAIRNTAISDRIFWNGKEEAIQGTSGIATFTNEARKAVKLRNFSSVVKVWDVFSENGTSYIVMDYVEGITLKEYLMQRNSPIEPVEAVRILSPILRELDTIHRMGIIHRDISPDNLMLKPDGTVILLDMGAAKDFSMVKKEASAIVARHGFSPPEQYLADGEIGPWTDVYAMCATLYYCVTGKPPAGPMERNTGIPLDLSAFSRHMGTILEKGLSAQPEDRYESMGELCDALEEDRNRLSRVWRFIRKNSVACVFACVAIALLVSGTAILTGAGRHSIASAVESAATITRLGTKNSNLVNYGGFAMVRDQYLYCIEGDNGLYIYPLGSETNAVKQKVCDHAGYITVGKPYVYCIATFDGLQNVVCRMNLDGSDVMILRSNAEGRAYKYLQYVEYSNGEQYLYYICENERNSTCGSLYRIDLSTMEENLVIEDAYWYNLYCDRLYCAIISPEMLDTDNKIHSLVISALPDGTDRRTLCDDQLYPQGFVEEDRLFLFSLDAETFYQCDLEGNRISGTKLDTFGELDIDISGTVAYDSGWFYYGDRSDGNLHRIRSDGTGDQIVLQDHSPQEICFDNAFDIWFMEYTETGREHEILRQTYLTNRDGEYCTKVGAAKLTWDLQYLENKQSLDRYAFDYDYEEDYARAGVVITGYHGSATCLQIPDKLGGKPVTAIGKGAFQESIIEKVALPETLVTIGERAFFGCGSLCFVGMHEGVTSIDYAAFGECESLKSIMFPETLCSIGENAFAMSGLTAVHIPKNVTSIGEGAFAITKRMGFSQITVSEENHTYLAIDNVLFSQGNRHYTLYDSDYLTSDGYASMLICYPAAREGAVYHIPTQDIYVTAIGKFAFYDAELLTRVEIPDSVEVVRYRAFYATKLSEVTVRRGCIVADDIGEGIQVRER